MSLYEIGMRAVAEVTPGQQSSQPPARKILPRPDRPHGIPRAYVTFAQIATVLSDEEIPREMRTTCRSLMVQDWQRNEGAEFAEFLDQQLRETEESIGLDHHSPSGAY